jgi:AmmeMemoRadiSam system protein B
MPAFCKQGPCHNGYHGIDMILPALRRGLDLMPSPVADRPGLLIRDPFRYSEQVLIIPPPLVPLLAAFDGEHTDGDLREALVRLSGNLQVGDALDHIVAALRDAGFLDDEVGRGMRDACHSRFAGAATRAAAHAGAAYPDDADGLRETLARYLDGAVAVPPTSDLLGIAAPHVSPEGGVAGYRAAYRAMGPGLGERTFLVLGTSHYGEPETFGLTRKPFVTPLGETRAAVGLVDALCADGGEAVRVEDYCHAVEHSIEFQVVFLQHLYGPDVRVVPVLCGPFARATLVGGYPEDDPAVARFLEALQGLARTEGSALVWVLGIDMSHLGRRYGDAFHARAGSGRMATVVDQDRARLERAVAGDAHGFWSLLQDDGDPLRWCGAAPLYTFLHAARPASGALLHYGQWNIDEASVVSFAALSFSRGDAG